MNRSAEQTNRTRTASRFTRFVCPSLRFIPHEPRKKDTHSLIDTHQIISKTKRLLLRWIHNYKTLVHGKTPNYRHPPILHRLLLLGANIFHRSNDLSERGGGAYNHKSSMKIMNKIEYCTASRSLRCGPSHSASDLMSWNLRMPLTTGKLNFYSLLTLG